MPRLFIAIPMPVEVLDRAAAIRTPLPGARWVPPEQVHLTLHFLGEVDPPLLEEIAAAVEHPATPAFPLTTGHLGAFPSLRQPRVLWLGLEESSPLRALHLELGLSLARIGLEGDTRAFHPHLTLARLKGTPTPAVAELIARPPDAPPLTFQVDRVILYESILSPGGATHLPRATGMLPKD